MRCRRGSSSPLDSLMQTICVLLVLLVSSATAIAMDRSNNLRSNAVQAAHKPATDVSPGDFGFLKEAQILVKQMSVAPWERIPAPDAPAEIFLFEELEHVFTLAEYGVTSQQRVPLQLKITHALLKGRLCDARAKHCELQVSRCLTCVRSWYMAHIMHNWGPELLQQSAMITNSGQVVLGARRLKQDRLDIDFIVPYACLPARVDALAHRFRSYRNFTKVRLLLTNFKCGEDSESYMPSTKLKDKILSTIGFKSSDQVQVLEPDDPDSHFSRAKALNILHQASRDDATVVSLDIDIEVKPQAFDRIRSYVIPGVSMYFPIVWSNFNPEHVKAVEDRIYNKKPLPLWSPYKGVWRKFGFGIYAIAGSDAKAFRLSESYTQWGGEDDDFFSRMQKKLHIIRAREMYMIHHWHPESCNDTKKSCFMSGAILQGSALSFQVEDFHGDPKETIT